MKKLFMRKMIIRMSEPTFMRQDNNQHLKRIHFSLSSDLYRLARAASALDEESFSLWLADAIQKKLQAYPFLDYNPRKL